MKKILTLVLTLIMSVVTCFGFSACAEGGASDIGIGDGKLVIGYTKYPPMNYNDETTGAFVGFDTDLAKAVCELLKVECQFVEIVWKNKVMSLNSKEIDVVWNGMTITDELKESMSITNPYYENKQVIVCRAGTESRFSKTADKKGLDLAGLEILAEAGSAGENTVKDLGLTVTGLTAQKDALLELNSDLTGNKVAVIDKIMADFLVGPGKSNPELTYVDVDFALEYFGIGCRKNDIATTYAIEQAIDTLKENGTFETIRNRYFG